MNAPFVCKVYFYKANRLNRQKNAAHVRYIGTRPGVEQETPDTPAGHARYAHERPGSHGLFGPDGPVNLKKIQQELNQHQGLVWRVVLSLEEADAIRLGLIRRAAWEQAIRAAIPEAAAKMGIGETNLRWVAAFHAEKGHPHVHLLIWEKKPWRIKGILTPYERQEFRKTWIKHLYGEERIRLLQEKTAARDLIRDLAKESVAEARKLLRELKATQKEMELELRAIGESAALPPKAYPEDVRIVAEKLKELAAIMPGRGRAALQFMPPEVKEKAREAAEVILASPAFQESYQKYIVATEQIARMYTARLDALSQARRRAHEDLRDRIANILVRGAVGLRREEREGQRTQQRGREERNQEKFIVQSVVQNIWKSIWSTIEGERRKAEAQKELMRRKRERERERERDEYQK